MEPITIFSQFTQILPLLSSFNRIVMRSKMPACDVFLENLKDKRQYEIAGQPGYANAHLNMLAWIDGTRHTLAASVTFSLMHINV